MNEALIAVHRRDADGSVHHMESCQFVTLPRIGDGIRMSAPLGPPLDYQVVDVVHCIRTTSMFETSSPPSVIVVVERRKAFRD